MSINRVDLQGAMVRTTDYSTIKQNEDNKGQINQTGFQQQFTKELNNKNESVNEPSETQKENRKFDAKEKGSNEYSGNGGKKKKKEQISEEGIKNSNIFGKDGKRVTAGGNSMFDLKI